MEPRLKEDRLTYLKSIDSPTLSNAIEDLNVRPRHEGFAPDTVRCLFPELGRMCGYAVTAQVETVSQMSPLDRARAERESTTITTWWSASAGTRKRC